MLKTGPDWRSLAAAFLLTLFPLINAVPAAAEAPVPLNKEAHINEQLVAVVVGDTIRKTCPTISARMITVYIKAKKLEQYARDKGYSEAEVKVFLKDKAEKARVKGLAAAYIAKNGVVKGDTDSYCRLGRAEIEKGSLIGSLLSDDE